MNVMILVYLLVASVLLAVGLGVVARFSLREVGLQILLMGGLAGAMYLVVALLRVPVH